MFEQTVAIVRSFKNPGLLDAVLRLLDAGIAKVRVVTDLDRDEGATERALAAIPAPWKARVQLIGMSGDYTWSNALNRGIKSVVMENRASVKAGFATLTRLLNVSVEAQFSHEDLVNMHSALNAVGRRVAVVGTSFKASKPDGTHITLGPSYRHPRNTGMLVNLEAAGTFFGFDPACDAIGGMEDIDFILAVRALSTAEVTMLDLQVPLLVGVNYDQAKKEEAERNAITKIVAKWRAQFPEGTEERTAIEQVITDMQLPG